MESGELKVGQSVRLIRREIVVGKGVIKNIQQQKTNVTTVKDGEFGMQLESRDTIAPGDRLEAFEIVIT